MATATAKKPATSAAPLAEAPKGNNLVAAGDANKDAAKDVAKKAGERYLDDLFNQEHAGQIAGALGNSLPYEAFKASVASAVMNNPELLGCKPGLLFREVIRIARLGLVFDQQLGEAYLIAGYNWKTKLKDTPQARVGYRGLMKLARNESNVTIYSHEVRAKDTFKCILGLERVLIHEPDVFATDRGDVIGFYAVAKFSDGEPDFEPMSQADINAIRDRTEAYKAFAAGKIKSTPWGTDPVEMGKKTVIRRLCKRLPMGPKFNAAIEIEDGAEGVVQHERIERAPHDGGSEALNRFAASSRRGQMTEVPVDERTVEAPREKADDASAPEDENPPPTEEPASGEAYVEPEESAPTEAADDETDDALQAPIPKMDAEAERAWTVDGVWMPGWKWLNAEIVKMTDGALKQALVDEHGMLLRAVAGKSAGYKDAVTRFLSANACKLEDHT